mmetsp:Transcript_8064/g.26794  ORF Transcript_8064/g.26794 Transcript_8064/m.26794 type:complete len:232 (-) Transcript_8064:411-1106(-)
MRAQHRRHKNGLTGGTVRDAIREARAIGRKGSLASRPGPTWSWSWRRGAHGRLSIYLLKDPDSSRRAGVVPELDGDALLFGDERSVETLTGVLIHNRRRRQPYEVAHGVLHRLCAPAAARAPVHHHQRLRQHPHDFLRRLRTADARDERREVVLVRGSAVDDAGDELSDAVRRVRLEDAHQDAHDAPDRGEREPLLLVCARRPRLLLLRLVRFRSVLVPLESLEAGPHQLP